ncbi:MAG: LrgB family protein [Rikenellaceae bacterium]
MLVKDNELLIICLNIGAYILGALIIKATRVKYVNALIFAILLIIAVLQIFDIDYQLYKEGSRFISFLLGPSVVAMGYMLHKQIAVIRQYLIPILVSIVVGATINIAVINIIFSFFDVDNTLIYSIQPKSVTTAIAISLSEQNGGIVSLTAIITVFTGILGSIIGPPLLDLFKIDSPIARGLALGASAHGIGTARAVELGAKEGAVAGLAIGLMGVATSLILLLKFRK